MKEKEGKDLKEVKYFQPLSLKFLGELCNATLPIGTINVKSGGSFESDNLESKKDSSV